MKSSVKIAFAAMAAALSTTLMFLTGLAPMATIALPALAGCILIPVVAELNVKWGFGVYAVCAVLSAFIVPDREAFLIYALFFGYYPALYGVLSKMKSKALSYLLKFLIFNIAAVSEALITVYVLGIPFETVWFLGAATPIVLLALANLVFFLYDSSLNGIIVLYIRRVHPMVKRMFK